MTKKLAFVSVIAFVLGLGSVAYAQAGNTPVGRWSLTAYNDNTPNMSTMATQTVSFFANGTWTGSFPGWGGRWFQKGVNAAGNGDRVRIVGNYANGVGNDSAEIEFHNVNHMDGAWSEWRDNYVFLAWARVVLTRLSTTPLTEGADLDATIDDGTNPTDKSYATPPVCEPQPATRLP